MEYIDAELLKTGLTRLGEEFPILTYEAVLYLINSLQQEQQQEVDLEKEIEAYFKDWSVSFFGAFFNEDDYKVSMLEIKDIARHFYKLGKNSK